MTGGLTIGQVASAADVRPPTIRYYEKRGLLPAPSRTPSGYRLYSPAIVRRLVVIRSAQQFGFSLDEIAGFLRMRDRGGKPCEGVRDAARQIVAAVDRQIADLVGKRRQMVEILALWDERLGHTGREARAYLLEMLSDAERREPDSTAVDERNGRRLRSPNRSDAIATRPNRRGSPKT